MILDIYTDGACSGNPGQGGYAVFYHNKELNEGLVFMEGSKHTTNNIMELKAVIAALKFIKERLDKPDLKESIIAHIYSDSKYVLSSLFEYMPNWILNGWRTSTNKPVKNIELMKELQNLWEYIKNHPSSYVELNYVKGHNGNWGNEIVDSYAVLARNQQSKPTYLKLKL